MDITVYLYPLIFLMIIAALIAVETTNLLSSIISMGAIGFLLSIAFLVLGAPDIAITQIVVEIIVLVILIRATINRDLTAISGDREFFGLVFTIAMIFILSLTAIKMFSVFPAFGTPVMDRLPGVISQAYLAESLPKTGSANVIEAILLDFRGLDTLAAVSVLFCAVIGGLALLRKKARKQLREPDAEAEVYMQASTPAGMSLMVKTVTRWIKGFILLYAIYLLLYGHSSPGGGFTGGVIFACSLILVTLAEGQKNARTIGKITAAGLACLGGLLFLSLAVFGETGPGHLYSRFIVRADAAHPGAFNLSPVQLSEIGIGLLVGSALYLIFSYLSALHVQVKDGEREMVERRRE